MELIAVIAVAPTGKASFVFSYMETRLKGQYNEEGPFSLICVLKLLITAVRAIKGSMGSMGDIKLMSSGSI